MEHFFPQIQVDTYTQIHIRVKLLGGGGGDADVDHSQTIGGDAVKLLRGYISPGFRHPCLNLLLQSLMPVVLARLRTDSQIDGNLCGINGKTAEDKGVCRLDIFKTTYNKSP